MSCVVSKWSGKCWCKGERELVGATGSWISTTTSCNLVLKCEGIVVYMRLGSPVQGIEKLICS